MAPLKLKIACWDYDRTRAIANGTVQPEGIELSFSSSVQVGEIMQRALKGEFDVTELGFTYYLRSLETPNPPFIAIPVFPNRFFRHATVFINKRSGIAGPRDLIGRKVGELHRYGHDAGIWAKGALSDDYGVPATSFTYYVGPLDKPASAADWAPPVAPPGVRIHALGTGQTLDTMLESGEIDALFSAWVPPSLRAGSPNVGYLFEDYEAVERDYFRRTSVFPIMHTVVIRRDVYHEHPWIARPIVAAFQKAKDLGQGAYRAGTTFFTPNIMIPWMASLQDRNRAMMGDDYWPYGVERNRKTLETLLRYHREQGLLQRDWKLEELFAEETLG
jgi:ABC-type nitrate/sulfonate/bicarbonate transport system substrate-binding protein